MKTEIVYGKADTNAGSAPLVCLVIPCHNGVEDTLECLASVARMDYSRMEAIVIDDGSTDGTADLVAASYPSVTVLRGDGSLWWSGVANLGIAEARRRRAAYILLLNNDCIVAPDLASRLLRCAGEHPHAVVGSRVYDYDSPERIWFTGGKID